MITVTIEVREDGLITENFGGDAEGRCCGPESREIADHLAALGVIVAPKCVACRLTPKMRAEAVRDGRCIATGARHE